MIDEVIKEAESEAEEGDTTRKASALVEVEDNVGVDGGDGNDHKEEDTEE
jgi:hypothetical protein